MEDNEEKSNQKLIRRDTPHYTKRARIQSKTADGSKCNYKFYFLLNVNSSLVNEIQGMN